VETAARRVEGHCGSGTASSDEPRAGGRTAQHIRRSASRLGQKQLRRVVAVDDLSSRSRRSFFALLALSVAARRRRCGDDRRHFAQSTAGAISLGDREVERTPRTSGTGNTGLPSYASSRNSESRKNVRLLACGEGRRGGSSKDKVEGDCFDLRPVRGYGKAQAPSVSGWQQQGLRSRRPRQSRRPAADEPLGALDLNCARRCSSSSRAPARLGITHHVPRTRRAMTLAGPDRL